MNTHMQTKRSREAGFTLVELAIVMIIIGLLIGGILKGQELIKNAQIASTVGQLKGITAAVNTFRDSYNALPGDMINAAGANGRLPNCVAANNCFNGSGDSFIGTPAVPIGPNTVGAGALAVAGAAGEPGNFWKHLNVADLVTGTDTSAPAAPVWGITHPAATINGGYVVGQHIGGLIANQTAIAPLQARAGRYLILRNAPNVAASNIAGQGSLSPSQAARIDVKMDDGSPNSGSVLALGNVGAAPAATCATAGTAAGIYNEQVDGQDCSIAVRFQ